MTSFRKNGKRRKLTETERAEVARDAHQRATSGRMNGNYVAILTAFSERGIPLDDIRPRENVLTYHAWRHVGRQVRRGEKGVRVTTWIPVEKEESDGNGGTKTVEKKIPKTAIVFHVTQTDPA
jgi:antirestriction protein ArdC